MTVLEQREIGADRERLDGPAKVTGTAPYAAEHPFADVAYAHPVQAAVARGTITAIYTRAAAAVPGVIMILTHENAERLASDEDQEFWVLQSPEVHFRGQFAAVVIAGTAEAAREAAELVEMSYDEHEHDVVLRADHPGLYAPEKVNPAFPTDTEDGDVAAGLASAAAAVDATYTTPANHNNPMEPHTTVARWDPAAGHLILHDSTQSVHGVRELIAPLFGLETGQVTVIAPHIGGGFGAKGTAHAHDVLACLAARAVPGRDVKLPLTRQMMYSVTGYRTPTIQRMRLGADADGYLLALVHEVWEQTSRIKEFAEQTAVPSRVMYASRARRTSHRLVPLDVPIPSWMRAPGENPGMYAGECAMDERARDGPDRAAHPKRAPGRPRIRPSLLDPQPGRLPAPGRRAVRLARPRPRAVAQAGPGRPPGRYRRGRLDLPGQPHAWL
jgi:xanthine dehydrogenase YagR molybdenum-binding subunit